MFFNKGFSRSSADLSWRDKYRRDNNSGTESRFKFFNSPFTSAASTNVPKWGSGAASSAAKSRPPISLYTRSLGLTEPYKSRVAPRATRTGVTPVAKTTTFTLHPRTAKPQPPLLSQPEAAPPQQPQSQQTTRPQSPTTSQQQSSQPQSPQPQTPQTSLSQTSATFQQQPSNTSQPQSSNFSLPQSTQPQTPQTSQPQTSTTFQQQPSHTPQPQSTHFSQPQSSQTPQTSQPQTSTTFQQQPSHTPQPQSTHFSQPQSPQTPQTSQPQTSATFQQQPSHTSQPQSSNFSLPQSTKSQTQTSTTFLHQPTPQPQSTHFSQPQQLQPQSPQSPRSPQLQTSQPPTLSRSHSQFSQQQPIHVSQPQRSHPQSPPISPSQTFAASSQSPLQNSSNVPQAQSPQPQQPNVSQTHPQSSHSAQQQQPFPQPIRPQPVRLEPTSPPVHQWQTQLPPQNAQQQQQHAQTQQQAPKSPPQTTKPNTGGADVGATRHKVYETINIHQSRVAPRQTRTGVTPVPKNISLADSSRNRQGSTSSLPGNEQSDQDRQHILKQQQQQRTPHQQQTTTPQQPLQQPVYQQHGAQHFQGQTNPQQTPASPQFRGGAPPTPSSPPQQHQQQQPQPQLNRSFSFGATKTNQPTNETGNNQQKDKDASSEGGKGRRITNLRQPQSPPTTTTRDRDRRSESSKSPAPSEDAPFSGTRSPVHGTGPAPAESTILRPGSAAGSRPSTATPLSDQARSPEPPPVSPPQTEWDDIEPGARHPPIPNPPQTGASSSTKKDDRPYPTPGSFIPAHYCTFLYCMSETSATRHLKKGEYVGLPVAFPHEISTKSFENHRKFVYATIIDIINLKEFRPDASNLLRLNIGANRKTKTAEFKDVYRICNEDPAKEIVEEEEAEKNKSASHDEAEPKMGQEDENGSDTYRSPSESSYSNSASGTGTSSRAEREDPKSPEEERKARKDLEEKARKKLEEERLRRKQAKEAEWRAKYGFDKEDPLLKKKQQKEERKKTFWERCSGMNGSFPEESSEDATVDEDIFDIEEMKEKISEALDDAWEKPEAIRKKIVKRLLLEWHPDKNPDKSEEAKILFQHLQKELKRCEEGIPRIKLSKWRDFMFGKRKPGGRGATRAQSFRTAAEEEKQEGSSSPRQSPFMKRKEFAAGSRSFDSQAQPQTSKSDSPPFQPKEPQNSFKDRYNSRFKDSFGSNSTANDNGARANENESATHDSKGRRFSNISQTFDASEEPDDELGNGNFSRFRRTQSSHESRDTFYKSYIDRMRETRARARGQSPGREPSAEPSPEPSADKPNNWRGNFDRDRESQKSWRNGSTQGAECRRWHGQAQRDLKSASHDFDAADASYEWVCYKCHHSAEKALKAVVIAQNLPMPDSHDLNVIAAKTQNAQLIRLSNQMTVLLGDHERMVYPNAFHSPKIPADAYTQGIATMALSIAKSIINCSDLIVLRFR